MITVQLPKRGTDDFGSGAFKAKRGSRKHKGIDYDCPTNASVLSQCAGHVTKHGYCYSDDLSFRYVQVTDALGRMHRYFYVQPAKPIGAYVNVGDEIGHCQDISKKWSTDEKHMKNHVHYEIMILEDGHKIYLNPENLEDKIL